MYKISSGAVQTGFYIKFSFDSTTLTPSLFCNIKPHTVTCNTHLLPALTRNSTCLKICDFNTYQSSHVPNDTWKEINHVIWKSTVTNDNSNHNHNHTAVGMPCVDVHAAIRLIAHCTVPSVQQAVGQHTIRQPQVNMYARYASFSGDILQGSHASWFFLENSRPGKSWKNILESYAFF